MSVRILLIADFQLFLYFHLYYLRHSLNQIAEEIKVIMLFLNDCIFLTC